MKAIITLVASLGCAVDGHASGKGRPAQPSSGGPRHGGVQRQEDCRAVVEGDACYQEVVWAMTRGVVDHPEWYATLTANSSFEDFQEHLHGTARLARVCPPPCAGRRRSQGAGALAPAPARTGRCRAAAEGDGCYEEVTWAMREGVVDFPDLYAPLTANSSFDDFQRLIHSTNTFSDVCPEPCVPQVRAEHCRTSLPGDACYGEVTWAMRTGVVEVPEFYSPLTDESSRDDFQRFLHGPAGLSAICPEPCASEARAADCRAPEAGEDCYDEITWAMQTGVVDFPELYAPLTRSSSFEEFQRFLHGTDTLSDVCPEPCAEQGARPLRPDAESHPRKAGPSAEGASAETPAPTPIPTSAPTLRPGCPCICERCGAFPYMDLDGSDCLVAEELDYIEQFRGRFEEMDLDGDGCVNQTECAYDEVSNDIPPFQYMPPPPPAECDYGYFAEPGTSVCQRCNGGEVRRRRAESCDACLDVQRRRVAPSIDFDWLPDFDDCLAPVYLTEDITGSIVLGVSQNTTATYVNETWANLTQNGTRRRNETWANLTQNGTRRQVPGFMGDGPGGPGVMTNRICVNTTINGDWLTRGWQITVAKRNYRINNDKPSLGEQESYYETFLISDKHNFVGGDGPMPRSKSYYDTDADDEMTKWPACATFVLDHYAFLSFVKWDPVTPSCSSTDGSTYSNHYPCGCGIDICSSGEICDMMSAYEQITVIDADKGTSYGTAGQCWNRGTSPLPTPVPTVRAVGDPHLVNLQGEHFDINHEGQFDLLRIPQNVAEPAEFAMQATVRSEHGKPCTTYITEVELSGLWFDGKIVQLRSYLKSHSRNGTDKFLGVRVLNHTEHAAAPWVNIEDWTGGEQFLSAEGRAGMRIKVSLDKTEWYSKKNSKKGAPTVAGQFTVEIQVVQHNVSSTISIRQDLPMQEHLNVAMRRLGALGRSDIGGLLGFDAHPESLEAVTPECQRHRDGGGKKGPRHRAPAWKTKWEQIKARRASVESTDETDAAASLFGVGRTCVCASPEYLGLTTEEYVKQMAAGEIEGVITDVQDARLAEATWD